MSPQLSIRPGRSGDKSSSLERRTNQPNVLPNSTYNLLRRILKRQAVTVKVNWPLLEVIIVTVYMVPCWKANAFPSINTWTDTSAFGVIIGPAQLLSEYKLPTPFLTEWALTKTSTF